MPYCSGKSCVSTICHDMKITVIDLPLNIPLLLSGHCYLRQQHTLAISFQTKRELDVTESSFRLACGVHGCLGAA
ncbi:hypothetical protein QVD17_11920 [Tagetes erecta]|uniref:Uncharacterized protein n=1 Tax=Tagetes erecta TaxID=13708 RepID=A0AAD8KVB5_TARER|nr:hypothetical protein QVD17_11920 [Tagetes erecta]